MSTNKRPADLRRYKILTQQTHSVALENPTSFQVDVGPYPCSLFSKPSYTDAGRQRTLGGAVIHLQYDSEEQDMLRAASLGIRLTEDVLAGLAVVTGVPFGGVTFVQLMDVTLAESTPFMFLITPRYRHADEPITDFHVSRLRGMLAHWDVLSRGGRLRRAAGLYRRGLQQEDDLSAFQYMYMGLEALEPALAEQIGVSSGVEETKGQCEKCGAEFVKRRTVLNGVRAYIRGTQHPQTMGTQREAEWKLMNALRQKQFHSLADLEGLQSDAHDASPCTAHFLHDAICCLSHAHELESPEFQLVRGARQMVAKGTAEPGIDDALEECRPVVDLEKVGWDAHPDYGLVPQINFRHDRPGIDIGGRFFWVSGPLQLATEADLQPADFEPMPPEQSGPKMS